MGVCAGERVSGKGSLLLLGGRCVGTRGGEKGRIGEGDGGRGGLERATGGGGRIGVGGKGTGYAS